MVTVLYLLCSAVVTFLLFTIIFLWFLTFGKESVENDEIVILRNIAAEVVVLFQETDEFI